MIVRRPTLVPVVPEDQRPFPVRKGKFHFLILFLCYLMAIVLAFILNVLNTFMALICPSQKEDELGFPSRNFRLATS